MLKYDGDDCIMKKMKQFATFWEASREVRKQIWQLKSAIDEGFASLYDDDESPTADELYTVENLDQVKPFLIMDKEADKLYKWAVLKYDGDENVMKKMIQFATFCKDSLEKGRDTMDKAREAVKARDASDEQKDMVDRQQKGMASTKRLQNKVEVLRNCSDVAKLQCIQTDGCGEFQYFDLSKKKSNKIQTVGATFVFGKGSQRSMPCGCSSKHTKWKLIENMTAGSMAKDLAELDTEEEESKARRPTSNLRRNLHENVNAHQIEHFLYI